MQIFLLFKYKYLLQNLIKMSSNFRDTRKSLCRITSSVQHNNNTYYISASESVAQARYICNLRKQLIETQSFPCGNTFHSARTQMLRRHVQMKIIYVYILQILMQDSRKYLSSYTYAKVKSIEKSKLIIVN